MLAAMADDVYRANARELATTENRRAAGTLLAAVVLVLSINGALDPLPGSPPVGWHALPIGLVTCALACLWRKPPHGTLGGLLVVLAVPAATYARFGFDDFTQMVIVGVLAVVGAVFLIAYLAAAVLLWRVGWPAASASTTTTPLSDGADAVPEALAKRVEALRAVGFVPLAHSEDAEHTSRGCVVHLLHGRLGVHASAIHAAARPKAVEMTAMTAIPRPGDHVGVVMTDAVDPFPLPDAGGTRYLALPGFSAQSLLEVVLALSPPPLRVTKLPSGEELVAVLAEPRNRLRNAYIERGYIRASVAGGVHRYRMKGLAIATVRMLWPGRAILLDRFRREADAALDRR